MKRSLMFATLLSSTIVWAQSQPAPEPEAPKTQVQTDAESTVQKKLIRPLAMKETERSRFSRARLPATARRVRVTDTVARVDAKDQKFVTFAVDARHGWDMEELEDDGVAKKPEWRKDTIVGCVYVDS